MELYQKRAPVGERFPPPLLDSIVLRARSLAGLASGTVIQNQATVVFDYNDPIDTPLVKNTDQRHGSKGSLIIFFAIWQR